MEKTVFDNLTSSTLGNYLTKRDYSNLEMIWPEFFPAKEIATLTWEMFTQSDSFPVIADVVALDTSAPEKRRAAFEKLRGDVAPVRVMRTMDEAKIHQVEEIKRALQGTGGDTEFLRQAFDDVEFVVKACVGRAEWMALQALSQFAISLTTTNNAGVVTEADIDFQLPSANKEYIGSAGGTADADHHWTTAKATLNDPISDIEAIVSEARDAGVKLRYMVMSRSKFLALRQSDAVKNLIYGITITQSGMTTPTVVAGQKKLNEVFLDYGLPQVIIADSQVVIENANHERTSVDPWLTDNSSDKYVTFLPEKRVGRLVYCKTASELRPPKNVVQARKGPVLVQKFSEVNPIREFTVGQMNAFPIIERIDECWSLNTENHASW